MNANEPTPEWAAWVEQAEHDLAGAQSNVTNGFWDIAVVLAQQAAEKMVKAVWISRTGEEPPRTHAIDNLLRRLDAPPELIPAGLRLARGYLTMRYPGLHDEAPFRSVQESHAGAALADAERVIGWAKAHLP